MITRCGCGGLTNGQWAAGLEALLPMGVEPGGRPQVWTWWQLVEAIGWRARPGVPGPDVPEGFSWDRVYDLFRRRRRQRGGTRVRIGAQLQAKPT